MSRFLGGNVVDQAVADVQFAAGDVLETCDHTQGGGLTAAGRTNQNDEFLVLDIQAELLNSNDAFVGDLQVYLLLGLVILLFLGLLGVNAVGVDFLDVLQGQACLNFATLNAPTISRAFLQPESRIPDALRQVSTLPHRESNGNIILFIA